ncbi:hypothetical protein G7Z17_g2044 [Cylindrodendrum hubeiense]|uniref:2EXR domain-containing protein n=1 Tax=Cylindrodendrum hubeiense TaxID=595255 RepID=A0A9P5HIE3_9HYPO|nr:hypothetical protein G7Z17_g2044 [Cylindrodendrum hubeiense]
MNPRLTSTPQDFDQTDTTKRVPGAGGSCQRPIMNEKHAEAGSSSGKVPTKIEFQDLPAEIRQKIWQEAATTPRIICLHNADETVPGPRTHGALAIAKVNFEARQTVTRTHDLLIRRVDGQKFLVNPRVDLIFTSGIPHFTPRRGSGHGMMINPANHTTDLQNVVSVFKDLEVFLELPDFYYTLNILRPPDLFRFHRVRDFTILCEKVGKIGWVEGCQVYDPQVVGTRGRSFLWRWDQTQDEKALDEAEEYFEQKGIMGDAGVEWPLENPLLDTAAAEKAMQLHREYHTELAMTWDPWALGYIINGKPQQASVDQFIPRIGLMGYSSNETSMGGNWAGFRFFTDTRRVEFTPLAFSEVKTQLYTSWRWKEVLPQLAVRI